MPGEAVFYAYSLAQAENQAQNGGRGNNVANLLQQQFAGGQPQQYQQQLVGITQEHKFQVPKFKDVALVVMVVLVSPLVQTRMV
jgi:hypothetical protein